MPPDPPASYVITAHAALEFERRGLSVDVVHQVLTAPDQRVRVREGRDVLQSVMAMGPGSDVYLVRVFVDVDRDPIEVVTAYRTSKIEKYGGVRP